MILDRVVYNTRLSSLSSGLEEGFSLGPDYLLPIFNSANFFLQLHSCPSNLTVYKMASLLGAHYDSSDDETTSNPPAPPATKIVAAPEVNTEVWFLARAPRTQI